MTCTKLLVDTMSHTVLNKAMSAAVVEPVSLKPYWSQNRVSVGDVGLQDK